jgi:hypothetical protein
LRRSDVFDSVINFNGHIKAISKALEDHKNDIKAGGTPAAAEVQATGT